MLEHLNEMQLIRCRKAYLATREKELSAPLLTDLDRIDEIYSWFNEIEGCQNSPSVGDTTTQRKKFILIILSLYSPGALTGKRMMKGLRDKLTSLFSLHAHTTISNNSNDLLFLYQHYKNFRSETDQVLELIKLRLCM